MLCFYYPTPTGIELARPQEQLSTPAARRCRLPCVFKYNFSHCCCAICHSHAEFLVVSLSLSPVSSPRTVQRWRREYQGWDDRFLRSSWRPSSCQDIYMESVYSGESWTIYIKSLHACWPYLPSYRKANQFSLSDDFRPVSPSFGCCDCFNNLIVPCQLFPRKSRLFFLTYVRFQ